MQLREFIRKQRLKIALACVTVAAVVSFSFVSDSYFEVSKNLDIFTTLFRDVNMYYVDSIQPGELMKKGMDGMLKSLDPYTVYIPESDIEDYRMTHISAEYGGIGALVMQRDGAIIISEVYEGFPAQKSGLQVGDRILSVNGTAVKDRKVDDVSSLLKGQKGTPLKMTIQREGQPAPIEKQIVRDEIKFPNVPYFGMINENTGYIKLNQFLENSADEVRSALTSLKQNPGMKQVILDLRGNGGGLLKDAVEIVNLFVEQGQKIVTQKGKIREMNQEYLAQKEPVDRDVPVVVLVDRGSASASEIVTGAMQELDRGVIIGQRTFGKGLVQQTYNLSYNTLLKVTIAKYYTPSGRCIQALDYTHRNADGSVARVADSLISEYKTRNGRQVYDGSGIFPDIYHEKRNYSNVSIALGANYIYYDYAGEFYKKHPSIAPAKDFRLSEAEYEEFVKFVDGRKYEYTDNTERTLEELKKTAEKEKNFAAIKPEYEALKNKLLADKSQDIKNHREEIKELLENEIVSRYYYQKGRIESGFKYDKEIARAVEVLNDKNLYSAILKGEGNYKVIGKPGSDTHAKADSEDNDSEE